MVLASASSISRVVVWATIFIYHVAVLSDIFVTASGLSPIQLEREVLLNSSWWNNSWEYVKDPKSDPCVWSGIICNFAGSVNGITCLNGDVNIKGELGRFNFSCFPNLENFAIRSCHISAGSIPPQIGSVSELQTLELTGINLTGNIPSEIGSLRNLVTLNQSGNHLTGTIPSEIGNLRNLIYLLLSGNNLTRTIPPTLGHLTNLTILNLKYNQLNGSIPPELMNCSKLKTLVLRNNNLSGSIPLEIGSLPELGV